MKLTPHSLLSRYKERSHVAQAGLTATMYLRMTSCSQSSCLHLPNARITGTYPVILRLEFKSEVGVLDRGSRSGF